MEAARRQRELLPESSPAAAAAAAADGQRRSQERRLGQQKLLLLRRQGLALASLHKWAKSTGGGRRRNTFRRAPKLIATLRWCGQAGGGAAAHKPQLPTKGELAALQAHRHRSRRRRRVLRAKDLRQLALARAKAQQRARLAFKRRYKHKRREELERKAARRIARALRADVEAAEQDGGGVSGLLARPLLAPPSAATALRGMEAGAGAAEAGGGTGASNNPLLQPWAAARVKCESASALVQQTLRGSQLLPPEDGELSGVFDQMLIVGLPLESLREPHVRLGESYAPQVVYTFPEGALCTEAVADFCLPQGVTVTAIDPATGQPQPQPRPVSPASAPPLSGLCSRQRARLAAAALEEATEVLFVLSGGGPDGSETSYGMCLHVRRPYLFSDRVTASADLCYCFIAKHPFLPLHLGVLRALVRMNLFPPDDLLPLPSTSGAATPPAPSTALGARPLQAELEREKRAVLRITRALHRFALLPFPKPGDEVAFQLFEGLSQALALPIYFRRPPAPAVTAAGWGQTVTLADATDEDDEATRLVREWAAPVLLSRLGLERVLLVLLSMLTELQVVVVSSDLQLLSASVLAFATLLRPLVWAGPVIATLPQKHSDYLVRPRRGHAGWIDASIDPRASVF